MSQTLALPAPSVVDAAEAHLGELLSELDSFVHAAEVFSGHQLPLEDAVFLSRNGIEPDPEPSRHVDPAIIARLLVFADELLDDVDAIRAHAENLRRLLLTSYRRHVIERPGADRA